MFQKVLCTYDIDNKSEGLLYCPKPPESSFYNEDYYLDESLLNNLLVQDERRKLTRSLQIEEVK